MKAREWLAALARLGADDLRRIGRMVDLLANAERGKADQAPVMLDAAPAPADWRDARARVDAIVGYLEH